MLTQPIFPVPTPERCPFDGKPIPGVNMVNGWPVYPCGHPAPVDRRTDAGLNDSGDRRRSTD